MASVRELHGVDVAFIDGSKALSKVRRTSYEREPMSGHARYERPGDIVFDLRAILGVIAPQSIRCDNYVNRVGDAPIMIHYVSLEPNARAVDFADVAVRNTDG